MQNRHSQLRAFKLDRALEVGPEQSLVAALVVNRAGRARHRVFDHQRPVLHATHEVPLATQIPSHKRHVGGYRGERRGQPPHGFRVPDVGQLDGCEQVFFGHRGLQTDSRCLIHVRPHPPQITAACRGFVEASRELIPRHTEVADGTGETVLEQLTALSEVSELEVADQRGVQLDQLLRADGVGNQLEHAVGHVLRLEIPLKLQRLIKPLQILDGELRGGRVAGTQSNREQVAREGRWGDSHGSHRLTADIQGRVEQGRARPQPIRPHHLRDQLDPPDNVGHLLLGFRPRVDLVKAQNIRGVRLAEPVVRLPGRTPTHADFRRRTSPGHAIRGLGIELLPRLRQVRCPNVQPIPHMLRPGETTPRTRHYVAYPRIVRREIVLKNVLIKMGGTVKKVVKIRPASPSCHKSVFRCLCAFGTGFSLVKDWRSPIQPLREDRTDTQTSCGEHDLTPESNKPLHLVGVNRKEPHLKWCGPSPNTFERWKCGFKSPSRQILPATFCACLTRVLDHSVWFRPGLTRVP